MRQRMTLALSEFFVVSFSSMEIDWRGYTMTAYWDLLAQHAFGNFRELLEAITLNPAMGYFLNTRGNQKEDNKGRQPDENYAREIMQLFTIGLFELENNGTVKKDNTGKNIESYTSDDVTNLARVFTGYDYDKTYAPNSPRGVQFPNANYKVWDREYARRPMTLDENRHSTLEATFLGLTIPANTKGAPALKMALDRLFNHPNVGPFFGRQMIQRLVTSNPSPAYVDRVASAFNNNGSGVRGDMKAVWTAILTDTEALSDATLTSPTYGKLREPIMRFVQWARTFGVTSKAGSWKLFDLSDPSYSLGQSPMHSASVFNFFRPGYVPPGTALALTGATAPEFQIVNETTVGSYVNYMQGVIERGINAPDPGIAEVTYQNYILDFEGNYNSITALINNTVSNVTESERVAEAIVARLNLVLCAGQLNPPTFTEIKTSITAAMLEKQLTTNTNVTLTYPNPKDRVDNNTMKRKLAGAAILLVMACPDYLIQK